MKKRVSKTITQKEVQKRRSLTAKVEGKTAETKSKKAAPKKAVKKAVTPRKICPAIDQDLFLRACEYVKNLERGAMGIGTLSEKSIHAIMKYYYAPNPAYHEQKVGSYVADILMDGEIMEIQTRAFNNLRHKLDAFLPEHEVTIIHPIAHTKWLSWIDTDTGEVSKPHKSPKTGTIYKMIPELYKIKMYLRDEHLHFMFPLIDVQETRLLNGWSKDKKRGSYRNDGIPVGIYDEIHINTRRDYLLLLPDTLPDEFTVRDLQTCAHIPQSHASTLLGILFYIEVVDRIGKNGNAFIYRKKSL